MLYFRTCYSSRIETQRSGTSFVVRKCVNHGDSGRKWFVRPRGIHADLNTKLSTAIFTVTKQKRTPPGKQTFMRAVVRAIQAGKAFCGTNVGQRGTIKLGWCFLYATRAIWFKDYMVCNNEMYSLKRLLEIIWGTQADVWAIVVFIYTLCFCIERVKLIDTSWPPIPWRRFSSPLSAQAEMSVATVWSNMLLLSVEEQL